MARRIPLRFRRTRANAIGVRALNDEETLCGSRWRGRGFGASGTEGVVGASGGALFSVRSICSMSVKLLSCTHDMGRSKTSE